MEEKTAKIPSLKEFKKNHKEKEAQSKRSRSMQTKKQLERDTVRKSREQDLKTPRDDGRRKTDERVRERSPKSQSKRPARALEPTRRSSSQGSTPKRRTESDSRTYARDRIQSERRERPIETASRESTRRESEPLRQYRSQRSAVPQSRERAPQQNVRRPAERKGTASSRVPSKNTKPVKKPQKPKKPLSPMARKVRNIMVYVAIILAVLIIAVVLSLTVLFKTEQISVSGNQMYSAEEIIEASGLKKGENIFTANKAAASERIEKAYPYIEEADVYFAIPDTIKIDIKMASPSYMVESSNGFYVVSDKGKVLELSATDDEAEVPIIEGVTALPKNPGEYLEYGSDRVSRALEEIFSAFKSLGSKNITAVNVESKDETVKLKYVYDDRIVVYLGTPDNIYYKIHTADTIIKEKLDVNGSKPVGELDVSKSYETKKSYFNEYSILADNVAPTVVATEATEASENQYYSAEETYSEDTYYANEYLYE